MTCPAMVKQEQWRTLQIQALQEVELQEGVSGGLRGHLKEFSELCIWVERNFPVQM